MRAMRALTAAVVAGATVLSMAGCEKDDRGGSGGVTTIDATGTGGSGAGEPVGADGTGRNGGTGGGERPGGLSTREQFMLDNLPESGSVMAAGEFLQRFTACERYSIDPSDPRYYPMDEKFDATWGVKFRGTCNDAGGSYIRVFWTGTGEGMRTFQNAYRAHVADRLRTTPDADIDGGFGIGKDFAVIVPDPDTLRYLSASNLLVLNCNPNFQATGDVRTAPALVDGCVLTDDFTD
ncbi:hypothetical protein ACGF5F_34040 [Streptomyces sp. NPDC047821]|uniref:hypothetical protein n=1 Tax=Streptomyces sp. NPDC047821 TaxID=3365488 RepID=UPI003713B524